MARYYIADKPGCHRGVNERMDRRGFPNIEEMNEYMISQWNGRVRRNDEVVCLGDLSIGRPMETNRILERLNGRIFMIRGNHDKFLDKTSVDLSRFEWVKDYAEMNDNGRKVILCHYPIVCYNGQFRLDKEGNPKVYISFMDTFTEHQMLLGCIITKNLSRPFHGSRADLKNRSLHQ